MAKKRRNWTKRRSQVGGENEGKEGQEGLQGRWSWMTRRRRSRQGKIKRGKPWRSWCRRGRGRPGDRQRWEEGYKAPSWTSQEQWKDLERRGKELARTQGLNCKSGGRRVRKHRLMQGRAMVQNNTQTVNGHCDLSQCWNSPYYVHNPTCCRILFVSPWWSACGAFWSKAVLYGHSKGQ